jgi:hypothetical protein
MEYNEQSKNRLSNQIEKKCRTTMIGSLAAFEDEFGHLWGHGLPPEELSNEQHEFRELWQYARTRILDDGNSNIRAIKSEISQYDIKWKRFVMEFNVNNNRRD